MIFAVCPADISSTSIVYYTIDISIAHGYNNTVRAPVENLERVSKKEVYYVASMD